MILVTDIVKNRQNWRRSYGPRCAKSQILTDPCAWNFTFVF